MITHPVLHATFTLERHYPPAPERVFAAWADPAAKARWFADAGSDSGSDTGTGTEHHLDFRAGGRETVLHPAVDGEPALRFDAAGDGTRLVLTEQGTFLDGEEPPDWREKGTRDWLDALDAELRRPVPDA